MLNRGVIIITTRKNEKTISNQSNKINRTPAFVKFVKFKILQFKIVLTSLNKFSILIILSNFNFY